MKQQELKYLRKKKISINWDILTTNQRYNLINDIVKKHQFCKVNSLGKKGIIDGFSASAFLQILNALKPENKEKLLNMNLFSFVTLCWKLINKSRC